MNEKTYRSLLIVLDYLMPEERRHWQELGRPKEHVYRHLRQLRDWADEVAKEYTEVE